MQKWEYIELECDQKSRVTKVLRVTETGYMTSPTEGSWINAVNDLGRSGWGIVQKVYHSDNKSTTILRRAIEG